MRAMLAEFEFPIVLKPTISWARRSAVRLVPLDSSMRLRRSTSSAGTWLWHRRRSPDRRALAWTPSGLTCRPALNLKSVRYASSVAEHGSGHDLRSYCKAGRLEYADRHGPLPSTASRRHSQHRAAHRQFGRPRQARQLPSVAAGETQDRLCSLSRWATSRGSRPCSWRAPRYCSLRSPAQPLVARQSFDSGSQPTV